LARFPRSLAVSCASAWILVAPAAARTWLVPAEAPTVAAAFDSSAAGDTVLVSCGVYAETGLLLPDGVTLRGATGLPGCVTLDGGGAARILRVEHTGPGTRIEGITFAGGRGPASGSSNFDRSGGAVRCDSALVEVTDCAFAANVARFGGAVGMRGPGPAFTRCEFDSNAAVDSVRAAGGAIYAERADALLTDCGFTGNTAFSGSLPGDGGGVFLDFCEVVADGCTFLGNSSGAGGGAWYSYNFDTSSLLACSFRDNVSGAGGGAYVETAQPAFRDCSFTGNEAGNGGAVFCGQFGGAKFTDCAFDSNRAVPFSGGACDIWQSSPTFLRCSFRFNTAQVRGGGVSVNFTSGPAFTDCLFRANAAQDGGAVRTNATAVVSLTGCNLEANSASRGGGLFCEGQSLAIIDRTIIAGSVSGAAVTCIGSAGAGVTCSNLFGNAGGDWTGCVAGRDSQFGNLSADPLFCDAAAGDYTLRLPDSPCLPANNACGQLIGFETGGCGCPPSATFMVPGDQPTIAAALAVSVPGDTVGVCDGTYAETVQVVAGVHVLGLAAEFCTVTPGASPEGVLLAHGITDTTWIAGLTFDGLGLVPDAVVADSGTTALHLRSNRITGGSVAGVRNGPDSRVRVGGSLAWANDLFGNGAGTPLHLRNENTAGDSLDATVNWWGTTRYDSILTFVQGPVLLCPITNEQHSDSLCAPLSAVPSPLSVAPRGELTLVLGPNPFRDHLRVFFTLPVAAPTRIALHDVAGRRVRLLQDGPLTAGAHAVAWTGRDERGGVVAPGVYFLRLESGGQVRVRKILLLR
jgi:hypothetical protein